MPEYQFPPGNEVWLPEAVIALLCTKMSPDDWRPVTFCAVILAEAGGDPLAVSPVRWNPESPAHLSLDLGLCQHNTHWQMTVDPFPDVPRITVADALDPFRAFEHAWRLLNKGRTGWHYNMTWWSAFNSGAYDPFVSPALAGMRTYRETMDLGPGVFGE